MVWLPSKTWQATTGMCSGRSQWFTPFHALGEPCRGQRVPAAKARWRLPHPSYSSTSDSSISQRPDDVSTTRVWYIRGCRISAGQGSYSHKVPNRTSLGQLGSRDGPR